MTQSKPAASKVSGLPVPGNAVVLVGMTVVSIALGVAFSAHLGMPASAAITCAALIYVGLVVSHIAVVRGRKVSELEGEISKLWDALGQGGERSAAKVASRSPAKDSTPASSAPATPLARALGRGQMPEGAAGQLAAHAASPGAADPRALARRAAATATPAAMPAAVAHDEDTFTLEDETALARALAEPDEQPPTQHAPQHSNPAEAARQSMSAPLPPTLAAAARTLDASTIHEMVKKLATETAAASPPRAAPAFAVAAEAPELAEQTFDDGMDFAEEMPANAGAVDGDAITESVRALRAAADAMRPATAPVGEAAGFDVFADEAAERAVDDEFGEQGDQISLLAEALSADRMDVMLEPILGLKDHAPRHYEISVCLRTAEGAVLDPNDDRRALGGTGILPLIDLAKLSRIAEVSRRLAERGKTGSVFAGFAGESLADDDFLNRFADVYQDRTSITEQLVVSLAQEDVRVFAPGHWSMVKDLSGAGFRFALEHVTDLDMDFDALKAANIQYVKLDAEVYLRGLPASDGVTIPAVDVYKFLADKGLSLIVDHITTEPQLMRVVDCGALYGQGQLFGGPRSVKAQVFTARSAA